MAFSLAGIHRRHQLHWPWKPLPEKLPLGSQPLWFHLDFTALLPPSRLSDSACLSYHFPVLPKVLGMEKAGGRGGFLPLRLLLGCCARKVPLGRLLQTNAAPNTQLVHALSHLCHQIQTLFVTQGNSPIPMAAHSLSWLSKGGSELLQDHGIAKQFTEPKRVSGTFPLYQTPISTPLV